MEENHSKSIKELVIPIAMIAGAGRVFIDFIPKMLSLGAIPYYATFLVCFIIEIFLITKVVKKFKTLNNNVLTLKQALKIGVTLMFIIGIVYSVSSYAYDTFIDPNFQIETAIEWGETFGQGQAVRQQLAENPPKGSAIGILWGILWFSFLGFIISMIVGSVLRNENNVN